MIVILLKHIKHIKQKLRDINIKHFVGKKFILSISKIDTYQTLEVSIKKYINIKMVTYKWNIKENTLEYLHFTTCLDGISSVIFDIDNPLHSKHIT